MKLNLVTSGSKIALAVGVLGLASPQALAQDAAAPDSGVQASEVDENPNNVIVVSGVRQSIETSIDDKRDSSQIKDSINAEDIGQLANDNIAEALVSRQRLWHRFEVVI